MSQSDKKSYNQLDYPFLNQGVDEAYTASGEIRAHWFELLEGMQNLGSQDIEERLLKARRILRDDGATHKTPNDTASNQTWQLNPIPQLIDSEEWRWIENALVERARLFNLILEDVYGPRTLIAQRVIPPELVYAHAGFLRPCHGLQLKGEHQLILHGVDVVRGPDGMLTVMADRTQAPSGAGYALENRAVMNRVFPDLLRDSHVHRLSAFFTQLRQTLQNLNPNGGTARIVVLTPGAYNEAYFEHACLANYLGANLVQGSDLTVHDGFVWVKTLDGLKRVDVILRRVDDVYCDPLELKGNSQLGIPGLLEVARQGHVAVANPLGSGLLENPMWLRYLPDISRHLLGRDLQMDSVKTWWCGNRDELDYVCDNLSALLIKPIYRRPGLYDVYGATLDEKKLQAWKNRIRKNPLQYVAQEYIPCARTPTWHQGTIQPRAAILRTFAVASESSYAVLPGGLTRVHLNPDEDIISNQQGSVSKDTWIITSEPDKRAPLYADENDQPQETASGLPSRAAENLFWVGRYAERAESGLRLLHMLFMQLNKAVALPDPVYRCLLSAVTHVTYTYPGFAAENTSLFSNPEPEILSVLFDVNRSGSVAYNLFSLIHAAEQIKEQFSNDIQHVINEIDDQCQALNNALTPRVFSTLETTLDPLITSLLALAGLIHDSVLHNPGWYFIKTGAHIERALQIISVLRALLVPRLATSQQDMLIESALQYSEAHIPYCHDYQDVSIENSVDIVLLNSQHPRSLLYQLEQLEQHCFRLPDTQGELNRTHPLLLEAITILKSIDPYKLTEGNGVNLDQVLSQIHDLLSTFSDELRQRYFNHVYNPQPLVRNIEEQDLL